MPAVTSLYLAVVPACRRLCDWAPATLQGDSSSGVRLCLGLNLTCPLLVDRARGPFSCWASSVRTGLNKEAPTPTRGPLTLLRWLHAQPHTPKPGVSPWSEVRVGCRPQAWPLLGTVSGPGAHVQVPLWTRTWSASVGADAVLPALRGQ